MTNPETRKAMFRAAWDELATIDSSAGDLGRASLAASVVGDPDMKSLVAELSAPPQAQLDAHITGETVRDHETAAAALGKFLSRTAEAVNAVSKSINPRIRRLGDRLLVAAPSAGSVRIVMRVPTSGADSTVEPGPTVESQALDLLVTLMDQAEADPAEEDSALTATVRNLEPHARNRVRLMADTVNRAGWQLDGQLVRRGNDPRPVHLSRRGAARLRDELARTEQPEPKREALFGRIDGQLRTESLMQFIPDSGKKFKAAVTSAELMDTVARLAADADQRVRAVFDVYEEVPAGQQEYVKRSYHLTEIGPVPSPQQPKLDSPPH